MKLSKEHIFTVLKHGIVFALLMCATLLLLELPNLYYKKADSELLLEQGMSIYQLKSVNKNYILFSDKLKLFQNEYVNYALGEFAEFTEAEATKAEERLAGEMQMILGEPYEGITKALDKGEFVSIGGLIPVMDYSEEQVRMWDIGILVFTSEEKNRRGVTIYDEESGKIFWLYCEAPADWQDATWGSDSGQKEEAVQADTLYGVDFTEKYKEEHIRDSYLEKVKAYYDGVEVVWEENVLSFGEYVCITPLTERELERSTLLWEISMYLETYGIKM